MAGIPCVNNTCSVQSSAEAGTGRLNLDVILDADGGLRCVDGEGVGILLDPATGNKLSLSTAGLFGAGSTHQMSTGHGGTLVPFVTSVQTADSANFNVVNASATQSRLVVLHAKWQYQYTVTDDEWSSDGTFVLNIDGSTVTESFDIGGADGTPAADASDNKVHASHVTVYRTLGAGASMNVRAYGAGRSQDGNFTVNQFVSFVDVLVLDIPQSTAPLYTVT